MRNSAQTKATNPVAAVSGMAPPWVFLIFLHFLAIMQGVHSGLSTRPMFIDLIFPLSAAVAAVSGCANDARIRRAPLPSAVQFIMLFSWPVTVPIYLAWSRGWRGILWALLWMVTLGACYLFPAAYCLMLRTNR
jgi:hypothetical protein